MAATPYISVILPVYNSAAWVAATIHSILGQTFGDFELIVINDGSTDNSETVIRSFPDSRIRYLDQPNRGLVATLNRGIAEARGRYLARIDADDICLPERFAKQAAWLDAHPGTALVGSFVVFINERGEETGSWAGDRDHHTAAQIRQALPYLNCMTHPSVMARTVVMREYGYNPLQQHIEDYDLWLRMQADGVVMEKVPEVLLQYRVHSASVTSLNLKNKNVFYKNFRCKRRFLKARLAKGKLNGFDRAVLMGMLKDLAIGIVKSIKPKP
ncbi:glycosyltransferase [Chitinophaga lutea]|uniref:Glycosyltransferase n=1 Tax=Chitinophaga lutea TaxID=2488634 RepID=A0A3N4PIP9_9BACT|nr:glycosyltransferase [Chitinophaga lutea]RPE08572.1 glycosyltransferase [Chitinophaga lutea]